MNKTDFESLVWLYFDGEISETELATLRREIAGSAQRRTDYARLHRLHLATVVAVCGRTVDLRQVPPNLLTLLDTEAAPDTRKIVAFAASFGAVAACAALAFFAFSDKGAASPDLAPNLANVAPAAPAAAAAAPTPAPVEIVGRYAPTSPGAKALSESTRNLENITADTFSFGTINRRQSPAVGLRDQNTGFDMTPVGNDSDSAPAASPAVFTDDLFQLEEDFIGSPEKSSNLPTQPLIIR